MVTLNKSPTENPLNPQNIKGLWFRVTPELQTLNPKPQI